MGYSRYDAAARGRAAWNAGKTVGTKRPLTQKQIWAIRFFLDREGRVGTSLAAMLTGMQVDTLVIAGATTSGCVRASVVDAVQSGFNTLVPADCCADRARPPHTAALYDMDQKYADVTDADDIERWLTSVW